MARPASPLSRACGASADAIPPLAYTVEKLHELAPLFWRDGASSNCTILLRAPDFDDDDPTSEVTTCTPPPTPPAANEELLTGRSSSVSGGEGEGETSADPARGIKGDGWQVPVLKYKLHRDYLAPQSHLFQRFLTSPLSPPLVHESSPGSPASFGRAQVIPARTTTSHTTLLLTLPDPSSFGLIVHWLYWGDAAVVQRALVHGDVCWKGLVRNIQCLGLDRTLKILVGRFWKAHILPLHDLSVESDAAMPFSPPPASFTRSSISSQESLP